MNKTEPSESIPNAEPTDTAAVEVETTTAPPPPEPWTPERSLYWNAYYDKYVAAGILLLAFLASSNRIDNSSLWPQIRAGQLTVSRFFPLVNDVFSFTMNGQTWVNIPWLFEVATASIYRIGLLFYPNDAAKAEQLGATSLVVINALTRALTALVLLTMRRRGPGLWWVAICVGLALGGTLGPRGVPAVGGIAQPADVSSSTWGILFLAIELALLHRALNLGKHGAAYGLVALFALWANTDESFLYGLIVLALSVLGISLQRPAASTLRSQGVETRWPTSRWLLALGICAAAVLVNPSIFRVYPAAASSLTDWVNLKWFGMESGPLRANQLSFFGPESRNFYLRLYPNDEALARWQYFWLVAYYMILVGLGFGSFMLNRRRFSLARFLVFAFAAVMYGLLARLQGEFGVIWAATLALNGQEWYHDVFGLEGRADRNWTTWSVGGRAITLLATFGLLISAMTGYFAIRGEPVFGFGFNPDQFAFEAAEALGTKDIQGNVLNLTLAHGDALIWRAYPNRKTFIDSRQHLFTKEVQSWMGELRTALRNDESEGWRKILDPLKVSVVMVSPEQDQRVFNSLKDSPRWIEFYDDGSVTLFGRADAAQALGLADDLAYFESHNFNPDQMAFQRKRTVKSFNTTPTATSWIDKYFRTRALTITQPHVMSARRWLFPDTIEDPNRPPTTPDAAHALLAVGEARAALAAKPDDPKAYEYLSIAYRALMAQEAIVLQRAGAANPIPGLVMFRVRQRVTSLNFAIQTSPPPKDENEQTALQELHLELAQLFMRTQSIDMAREQLAKVREYTKPGDFTPEYQQQLEQLDQQIDDVRAQLTDMSAGQQTNPAQKAQFALSRGMIGMAIAELEDAEKQGMPLAQVKAMLVDLYCQVGQADKAIDIMQGNTIDDPSLETAPGMSAYRNGLVNLLLGNYEVAEFCWRRAITVSQMSQSRQAIEAMTGLLQGDPKALARGAMELPQLVQGQAFRQYELGLCLLEAGKPREAGDLFTSALTLSPELVPRAVAADYLEKMGRPVPDASSGAERLPAEVFAPG